MKLRFAEELLLLMLDEEGGALTPLKPRVLDLVFAGAALMDLQLEGRVDSDLESLIVLDPSPLDDDLLDPSLEQIVKSGKQGNVPQWIDRIATKRGDDIRERAIDRLVDRGLLAEPGQEGFLSMTGLVSRAKFYPTTDAGVQESVHLRIMRILFTDEIPDPRDVVIVGLAHSCGLFRKILSPTEFAEARERIEIINRMDLIGQAVSGLVQVAKSETQEDHLPSTALPRAAGLPFLGNISALKGNVLDFFVEQHAKHGQVFEIRVFRRPQIVMAGVEANEFLLRRGPFHLSSAGVWDGLHKELGAGRSVIGMDGPEHFRMRRALSHGLSRELLLDRIQDTVRATRMRSARWEMDSRLPGFETCQFLVADQLAELSFGKVVPEFVDDVMYVFNELVQAHVVKLLPSLWRSGRFNRAFQRVRRYSRVSQAARRSDDRRRKGGGDLLDALMTLHESHPRFLPETDLNIHAALPFFTGLDPAAGILSFALYRMLTHPEIEERMRAEAEAAFADGGPTEASLAHLDVTRRLILETIRMHPVFPAIKRRASTSFVFGGYRVAAGDEVYIAIAVPHFQAEYFPEPERFDIDRYLPGRDEHKQLLAYVPYGLGPHRCLGADLAEAMIALSLATLLHHYDMKLDPPNYRLKGITTPFHRPDDRFGFSATVRT